MRFTTTTTIVAASLATLATARNVHQVRQLVMSGNSAAPTPTLSAVMVMPLDATADLSSALAAFSATAGIPNSNMNMNMQATTTTWVVDPNATGAFRNINGTNNGTMGFNGTGAAGRTEVGGGVWGLGALVAGFTFGSGVLAALL